MIRGEESDEQGGGGEGGGVKQTYSVPVNVNGKVVDTILVKLERFCRQL